MVLYSDCRVNQYQVNEYIFSAREVSSVRSLFLDKWLSLTLTFNVFIYMYTVELP